MTDSTDTARDYRETLFLPKTDFPMRAGLPKAEPKWLERWERIDLYGKQRAQSKGCLLYTSPSPRDQRGSRMPSSA